ncbi:MULTISPECIES: dephospho-CoA kinase [Rhodanobacter]|uniref:dephospho-CoA kinase n=1 Tax=Rhodanobacter TaxID=75309 RepID=UPI00041B62EE|nr:MULTISPECIES: dephospho-CoA kinase [Rhodanobacter]KZC20572.1 dephospho-CoA kinase [Rhodanobacter denitrificans]UJJ51963.1 dephospho-CoA kinase [Rhodanobacter denitrificans]UJM94707.1 dephospho-CoA kinase [Rhodanobacter denitrificans]UJM98237.1 dephospho-CoA kinase [Rhodanobacter denitrificans]UJN22350.1 dephospho-CoA kinase [Rhodanobacter denitrificans]
MNARPRALVIALTGGVAAGKTAVTRRFEALGVHVHDADVAAREVIEPGTSGLAAVVDAFGAGVLDDAGRLDRAAMRRHVFADPTARKTLEAIIHPRVRQWLHERALAERGPYCLLAIPLLAENIEHYRWVDRVLLIDAPEAVQLARLIERDGIDETLASRMLAHQASRAERLAVADDVIENSGDESALDQAVADLHRRYLALAPAR